MSAQSAQQRFGLGTLADPEGTSAPQSTEIEVTGRGLYVRVRLNFGFSGLSASASRVFLMERPWNSVVASLTINGESAKPAFGKPPSRPVHSTFHAELKDLGGGRPGVAFHIPSDVVLKTISVEFCMAVDLLWHQGVLAFASPKGSRTVDFKGSWDLAGLPGATLVPSGAAGSIPLDGPGETRAYSWQSKLTLNADQPALWALTLDEKKAASLSYFAPSKGGTGKGCAAVAVVAPVRPQLVREAAKLAFFVEIRNPQEGLIVRELVAKTASTLKNDDSLQISTLGPRGVREVLSWTKCEDIDDDALAPLLEPSASGKPNNLMAALREITPSLEDATHIVLATPGSPKSPVGDFTLPLPTFILGTGQNPHRAVLEGLTDPTGGYVTEMGEGGIELFLERMRTRMSPPLLRDFRLDGWGLDEVYPPGLTQVYTDQPTFVFGLYDGLLPKTVTLTGFSPAGQKLAQRVKVVSIEDFDLMPLYVETARRWKGQAGRTTVWTASDFTCYAFSHPVGLAKCLEASEPGSVSSGPELMGPPKLGPVHTAVTMDDETFGGISEASSGDTLLAAPTDPMVAAKLESPPEPSIKTEASPVRITKMVGVEEEPEEAEPEGESASSAALAPDKDFEVPTGPPKIFGSGTSPAVEPVAPVKKTKESDSESSSSMLKGVPGASAISAELAAEENSAEPDPEPADAEPDIDLEVIPKAEPLPAFRSEAAPAAEPLPSVEPEPVESTPPPLDVPVETSAEATVAFSPPKTGKRPKFATLTPGEQRGFETAPETKPSDDGATWVERFLALEPSRAMDWLGSCPIDQLGLALAELEPGKAKQILGMLQGARRKAVAVQFKWGQLLEPEERHQACSSLAASL